MFDSLWKNAPADSAPELCQKLSLPVLTVQVNHTNRWKVRVAGCPRQANKQACLYTDKRTTLLLLLLPPPTEQNGLAPRRPTTASRARWTAGCRADTSFSLAPSGRDGGVFDYVPDATGVSFVRSPSRALEVNSSQFTRQTIVWTHFEDLHKSPSTTGLIGNTHLPQRRGSGAIYLSRPR